MKKVISTVLAFLLMFSTSVNAAEVVWSKYTLKGDISATVTGIEADDKVTVGIYNADDELLEAKSTIAEADSAKIDLRRAGGDYARVFVWDEKSLEPKGEITTVITADGITEDAIFSDNQQPNRTDEVVGYRTFDALSGEYMIKLEVTVWSKGDNAIMLGDSKNGTLSYGTSSAILLFNGDYFAVRNGNGNGSYAANAVNLCEVKTGEKYEVIFHGNTKDNTYQVIVSYGKKRYTSSMMHARTDAQAIDTIALVSNGKNTTVKNGCYSDFAFLGKNFTIITDPDDMVLAPIYVYEGFEGLYYGLKIDGKYVRGNNGRLSYDYNTVADESAMFIPRDMGDGSYAFVCRSSNNRITTPSSGLLSGSNLRSAAYATNDNTQHWVLEESENYSDENLSYYIKHIDSDKYIGTTSSWMYGDILALVNEGEKAEVTFEPLYNESLLYLVSKTSAYNSLTDRQRFMIESVYESVAGDIFGRYGGHSEWTPRIRMDNLFNEILGNTLTEGEKVTKLNEFLNATNGFIYSNQASYETVSTKLPGTEGLYCEIDEGVAGTYDFWRGTMLKGVLYKYKIYTAEGELEQTLNLYVQDDGTAQKNAETFKKVIVQIPYAFRRHLKNVKVRSDNANSYNGGGSDMYIRLNWSPDANNMRSTVTHELGHIIDSQNGYWASGGGWATAIAQDMYTPSTYGATNSTEDFAEFCRMYFQAYSCKDLQRGLKVIMPERYASFGRLRKQNMAGWGLWEDEYTS